VIHDFVSALEEQSLCDSIDAGQWTASQSGRYKQVVLSSSVAIMNSFFTRDSIYAIARICHANRKLYSVVRVLFARAAAAVTGPRLRAAAASCLALSWFRPMLATFNRERFNVTLGL